MPFFPFANLSYIPSLLCPEANIIFAIQTRPGRTVVRPSPAPGRLDRTMGRHGPEILLRATGNWHFAMGDSNAAGPYRPDAPGHAAGRSGTSIWHTQRGDEGRRRGRRGRRWRERLGGELFQSCRVLPSVLSGILGTRKGTILYKFIYTRTTMLTMI